MLLVSLSQIFSIPPYAEDVFPFYKSGYFSELDKGFATIVDSFLAIKSMTRTEYAWIFLSDIAASRDMNIRVYDYRGYPVPAPGEKGGHPDEAVVKILNSMNPAPRSEVSGRFYKSVIPLAIRGECKFCHTRWNKREMAGAISFERKFDASIYYTSERIIIFICISIALCGFLYAAVRWDQGKNIKELFDK
jgi:hypothetical protein